MPAAELSHIHCNCLPADCKFTSKQAIQPQMTMCCIQELRSSSREEPVLPSSVLTRSPPSSTHCTFNQCNVGDRKWGGAQYAQLESCKSAHLHCKKSEGLLHHLYAIKAEQPIVAAVQCCNLGLWNELAVYLHCPVVSAAVTLLNIIVYWEARSGEIEHGLAVILPQL